MFTSSNRPQRADYELLSTTEASSGVGLSKQLESVDAEVNLEHQNGRNNLGDNHSLPKDRRPWKQWILRVAHELVPSFCLPSTKEHKEKPPRPLSSTAWLDGLRGYAAFFVVWHHLSLLWLPWSLHDGFVDRDSSYLFQLPILRLVVSGQPWVFIFFVISGYTLSYRPLQLLQQGGSIDKACMALSSSSFRRWLRLFIPVIVLNLPVPLLTFRGWYCTDDGKGMQMPGAALPTMSPTRQPTLWLQYFDFLSGVSQLVDPFVGGNIMWSWSYNGASWTLPIELAGSILVYGVVLALLQCRPAARLLIMAALPVYASWLGYWSQFLFLSGIFLAGLNLQEELWDWLASTRVATLLQTPQSVKITSSPPSRRRFQAGAVIRILSQVLPCLMVLYVIGTPTWSRGGKTAPGYAWLSELIPTHYINIKRPDFFLGPNAAALLVLVLNLSPLLQRCFTTPFALYLGRISYSLYLIHSTIIHGPGFRIAAALLDMMGPDTSYGYAGAGAVAAALIWVICIWLADLGTRFVDMQAIRFARWLHSKTMDV